MEESESDPDFEEWEEDIVNDPDFDDLVEEEEEEQEEVRWTLLLGVEVGVVTGLGFASSREVVIVFFSFRSLSCELCFALEANDSEAMVAEEELFLLVTGSRGTEGADMLFFTDLSADFLLDVESFAPGLFSVPFKRSVVRLLAFGSRDLSPFGVSCPIFPINSLAFGGFIISLLFLAGNLFCSSSFVFFCCSSLFTFSFLTLTSCSFSLLRETSTFLLFCSFCRLFLFTVSPMALREFVPFSPALWKLSSGAF